MRKTLLVGGKALLCLVFILPASDHTQLHNWLTSYIPAWNKKVKTEMLAYPNPFTSQINVSVCSSYNQQVTTRIVDMTGKTIRSSIQAVYRGNNNFNIDGLDKLEQGTYMIEIIDEERKPAGLSRLIKN